MFHRIESRNHKLFCQNYFSYVSMVYLGCFYDFDFNPFFPLTLFGYFFLLAVLELSSVWVGYYYEVLQTCIIIEIFPSFYKPACRRVCWLLHTNLHQTCVKEEPSRSHQWPPGFHGALGSCCTDTPTYFTTPGPYYDHYRPLCPGTLGITHPDFDNDLLPPLQTVGPKTLSLLKYENNFLARFRFNTALAYLVQRLQTIFQIKGICGKTPVSEETRYGLPVLSPAASVASLPPPCTIHHVHEAAPASWLLSLAPEAFSYLQTVPSYYEVFPTDKHVTNSFASNLCYNIAFSLNIQSKIATLKQFWSSSPCSLCFFKALNVD